MWYEEPIPNVFVLLESQPVSDDRLCFMGTVEDEMGARAIFTDDLDLIQATFVAVCPD